MPIILNIERLNSTGQGVALSEGFTYFVDEALPGEQISGTILEKKKNYAVVRVDTWLQKSPSRTEPACIHFQHCGGCQLMHLNYAGQLEYKTKRVHDALKRIGKFPSSLPLSSCIPANPSLYYRSKIQFHVSASTNNQEKTAIGFFEKNSHRVVPIETCAIHNPLGNAVYGTIKNLLEQFPLEPYQESSGKGYLRNILFRSNKNLSQIIIVFIVTQKSSPMLLTLAMALKNSYPEIIGVLENINPSRKNTILGKESHTLFGKDRFDENLNGTHFTVSATSFFQVNPTQAEILFNQAIRIADLNPKERVLDAFCGTGTLSLLAAPNCKEIIGVESHATSISDAKANAKINNITNVQFVCGKAEDVLPTLGKFDTVLLDPPRKGCEVHFIEALGKISPKKIIYISCDPATMARDLALLTKYGYLLDQVIPVDMFPQTTHVECVSRLIHASN